MSKKSAINVLVIKPGRKYETVKLDNDVLKSLQKIVGGKIEYAKIYGLDDWYHPYVNTDGSRLQLEPNNFHYLGNIVIARVNKDGDTENMIESEIKYLIEILDKRAEDEDKNRWPGYIHGGNPYDTLY